MKAIRALVFVSVSLSAPGQTVHFDALQKALVLTREQLDQLQRWTPPTVSTPPVAPGSTAAERRLSQSDRWTQRENLPGDRILDDAQRGKLEIIRKVVDRWEFAMLAIASGLISEREWPGALTSCPIPPIGAYGLELRLTGSQIQQLELLQQKTGTPRRGQAMAVLTDSQKTQLWEFIEAMDLASEAIELKLIPQPVRGGEDLCH